MGNEKDVKPPTPSTVPPKLETPLKSAGSLVRLPSFRQPRDLTLGSGSGGRAGALGLGMNKARKTYAPNLNVQRNKLKEEVKVKEEQRSRGRNERGRGNRGRGERGRGRGSSNIIQLTSGVFSEGMGASQRSTRQKHYDSDTQFVPKPKLDLKKNYSVDFKEENERLRQLLQDDFVDDPDVRNDGVRPLQLPMIPTVKKKGTHKNISGAAVVKREKEDPDLIDQSSAPDKSGVQIKREPGDDGPMDFKPMSEDEGHVIFERHVKDLLSSREPEYILVQLPDCLPGLRPCEEPEGAKNATETLPEAVDGTSKVSQCTLSTMPEGCIGKIQLMKSGRAFLKLNTLSLPITMGTQVGFKQDLISVNLNEREKTGKMINLGQVKARLVMTPDWESLLGKA